jgi:hypothetical protein
MLILIQCSREDNQVSDVDLHFLDVFEIFDITPHMKFCGNRYPIPVLNHLNYPFSWAAFFVLTKGFIIKRR